MLPSIVTNGTVIWHIVYTAAVICTWASINNLGSLFTAWLRTGIASFRIDLLWCAHILVSLSNILLQLWLRLCHWRKQLMKYSSKVSSKLSELMFSLLGVVGQSGVGVRSYIGSVGYSGVILATFLMGAGSMVPATFSVGVSRRVLESFSVGIGEIVAVSFSMGVLVPSWDSFPARSISCPPALLPFFSIFFYLIGGVGSGSIMLISEDGGGIDISWFGGCSDGGMVWSWLAWSLSSVPG